jgi:hypothetical protein
LTVIFCGNRESTGIDDSKRPACFGSNALLPALALHSLGRNIHIPIVTLGVVGNLTAQMLRRNHGAMVALLEEQRSCWAKNHAASTACML